MANDNRKSPSDKDSRTEQAPTRDSSPGNPNRQNTDAPGPQQGQPGVKQPDSSRLHDSDRSVTDRTVRKSVIEHNDNYDGDMDRLQE